MASQTCEQRELMKLFKCVIDTGNEVLSAYFDLKVLSFPKYGGNFKQFLEDEKHFLYHQWEQKRTMCCVCPKVGCSIRRIKKMETWIFQKLYEANGIEDPAHVIKQGGCIQQLCLHKFVTRKIAVHELDITVLSFFLRIFANMSASENLSLDTVSQCRSSICHSWSSKCFPMAELNKMWKDLETHLINLSEVRYQRIVRKQIQAFRKLEIEREEIAELTNHINYIKEVVDDVNHNLNNNHNTVVSAFVTKFEKLYIKDSQQIQKSVSEQSVAIQQAQEEVVSVVKAEAHGVIESLSKTKADIMTKMSEIQEEMLQKFENVVFELKYDKPVKKSSTDEITEDMVKEVPLLWHIEIPSEWKEKDVANAFKDIEKLAEKLDIKIKFVRYGSLIILTTIPYGILHDKFKYEHAITMFLTRMMEVCKINTDMACNVKATIYILENDEDKQNGCLLYILIARLEKLTSVDISVHFTLPTCIHSSSGEYDDNVCIRSASGKFEDKDTQTSIVQEDKCFQVNSSYYCECCELKLQKEEDSKICLNWYPGGENLSTGKSPNESYRRAIRPLVSLEKSSIVPFPYRYEDSGSNCYASNPYGYGNSFYRKDLKLYPGGKNLSTDRSPHESYRPSKRPISSLEESSAEIRKTNSLPINKTADEIKASRQKPKKSSKDSSCSIQ